MWPLKTKTPVDASEEARVRKLQEQIDALKKIELPIRYVEVNRFEETNETYVREIATIGASEYFRFFLYSLRESIIEQLEKCGPDASALREQLVGELKGINIIRAALENAIVAYSQNAK